MLPFTKDSLTHQLLMNDPGLRLNLIQHIIKSSIVPFRDEEISINS